MHVSFVFLPLHPFLTDPDEENTREGLVDLPAGALLTGLGREGGWRGSDMFTNEQAVVQIIGSEFYSISPNHLREQCKMEREALKGTAFP